jgi:hypothetical protein
MITWCKREAAKAIQSGYRISQGTAMTAEEERQYDGQKWRRGPNRKEATQIGAVVEKVMAGVPASNDLLDS